MNVITSLRINGILGLETCVISIRFIIQYNPIKFLSLLVVYSRRSDRLFLPLVAVDIARVAESGLGRRDLAIINSHLNSSSDATDRFRVRDQRERERWEFAYMNYHSSTAILL